MSILEDISSLLQEGRAKQVVALVRQALDEGIDPKAIMNDGLLAGMAVIGVQFKAGNTIEIKVDGPTKIEVGDCQFSAYETLTMTSADGSWLDAATSWFRLA